MKIKLIASIFLLTSFSLSASELVYEVKKIDINRKSINNPPLFNEKKIKKSLETKKQLTTKHNYKIDFETLKKYLNKDIIKYILEFHWLTTVFLEHLSLHSINKIANPIKILVSENENYFAIQCKDTSIIILDLDNFKEITDLTQCKEATEKFNTIEKGTKLHVFEKNNRKFVLEMLSISLSGTLHKVSVKRPSQTLKLLNQMGLEQMEFIMDLAQRTWLTAYGLIEKNFDESAPRPLNYDQTKIFAALPEDILRALQNDSFEFEA